MKRLSGWQQRLEAFVRERRATPFAWGRNDCCSFAADAVQVQTGAAVLPHLRGYSTARAALRTVAQHGGLRALACAALGPEISPAFAGVGDVVLVRAGKREVLTVCNGAVALGPGSSGIEAIGMEAAVAAWRI